MYYAFKPEAPRSLLSLNWNTLAKKKLILKPFDLTLVLKEQAVVEKGFLNKTYIKLSSAESFWLAGGVIG